MNNKKLYEDWVATFRRKVAETGRDEDRRNLAGALASLANTIAIEDHEYTKAIELFGEAINICRSIGDKEKEALELYGLAGIYDLGLHNRAKAVEYLMQALALTSDPNMKESIKSRL